MDDGKVRAAFGVGFFFGRAPSGGASAWNCKSSTGGYALVYSIGSISGKGADDTVK